MAAHKKCHSVMTNDYQRMTTRVQDVTSGRDLVATCSNPLGIEKDSINIQVGFTVSSSDVDARSEHHGPSAWNSETMTDRSYIQVEFVHQMLITGIITQGSATTLSRVTHFKIVHSIDCFEFVQMLDKNGNVKIFAGNIEANTTNTVIFDYVFNAKCVKVIPTRRLGEDTAIRFELLGCDTDACQSTVVPNQVEEQAHWKKFVFDKEKIVTSMRVTSETNAAEGIPPFMLAYSRTCNFGSEAQIVKDSGGKEKIFTTGVGSNEIIIQEGVFPLRSQCFAVFTQQPNSLANIEVSNQGQPMDPHQRISSNTYHITFQGCNALEEHDALDTCGKTRFNRNSRHRRQKRVVGGALSVPGEWPWLMSLHFMKFHLFTDSSGLHHLCGASLIHAQWAVTSAHCFDDFAGEGLSDKNNWLVVLGEHYQSDFDGTEQVMRVDKIIKHPDFVLNFGQKILHDIALVKLSSPVKMSDYVNTICLEPNYTFPDETPCMVAGWGHIRVGGVGAELPYHVEIKVLSQSTCAEMYNLLPVDHEARISVAVVDSVMCAVADENGSDSCSGDSGGPLMCYHDNHWTQAGIVSLGYTCGDVRFPGIYTRINYFYDWIKETIANN